MSLCAGAFLRRWPRWWRRCGRAGIELWAVSSTNRWVIAEGCAISEFPRNGFWRPKCASKDGIITSEIVDVPTDEAKAAALKRVGLPQTGCGLWQLDSRPGDAGDGPVPLSGESFTGAHGGGGEARLGLLQAAGCRGRGSSSGRRIEPGLPVRRRSGSCSGRRRKPLSPGEFSRPFLLFRHLHLNE